MGFLGIVVGFFGLGCSFKCGCLGVFVKGKGRGEGRRVTLGNLERVFFGNVKVVENLIFLGIMYEEGRKIF